MLGLAWAANVEEELKKLETDRAAAALKGDVATLEKQTSELAPAPGEHVIKKHRYSGFFGTDLDIILREWGVDTVIISGIRIAQQPGLRSQKLGLLPELL